MLDTVAELTELNRTFASAEFAGDAKFFQRHLADDLKFRRASGKVVDKPTFLSDLEAPGNTNERLDASDIEVLPFDNDLALCSSVVRFKGVRGGKPVEGMFRNTRVFTKIAGVWQCALWFNTKEPQT
jgi:ketosteroid isomerase-like protein